MTTPSTHPLEDAIADYINGHLSVADKQRFEHELAKDPKLSGLVAYEKSIQSSLQAEPDHAHRRMPSFTGLESRLGQRPNTRMNSLLWLVPALSVALIFFLGVPWQQATAPIASDKPIDDGYVTLTDPAQAYQQPIIRIILATGTSQADADALAAQFNLETVNYVEQARALEVIAPAEDQRADLTERLSQDQRVRQVRILGQD